MKCRSGTASDRFTQSRGAPDRPSKRTTPTNYTRQRMQPTNATNKHQRVVVLTVLREARSWAVSAYNYNCGGGQWEVCDGNRRGAGGKHNAANILTTMRPYVFLREHQIRIPCNTRLRPVVLYIFHMSLAKYYGAWQTIALAAHLLIIQ